MSRVTLRQVASKSAKMLLKRPTPQQVLWLNFAVTYLCNGRCRMCRIWTNYREQPGLVSEELSLHDVEKLLCSKYLRHLQGVSFTGGEPFLRGDLVHLVGLFIRRYPDAFVGIATNGLSTELIVRKTKQIVDRYRPRLLSLSISLDGLGAKHDAMRGVKGAYDRVLRTVDLLRSQVDVNLGFEFTVTPWNYRDLWVAYELSKQYGVKFLAAFAHKSDFYYGNVEIGFDWEGKLDEASAALRHVAKDRAACESLLDKVVDPYSCFMSLAAEAEADTGSGFTCYSGVHSLFLDPYGDVYPCILLDKKLGNIRADPFDRLWLSPRADEVRAYIGRHRCDCWVPCETVPSLLRGLSVPKWNLRHKLMGAMLFGLPRRASSGRTVAER